MLLSSNIAEHQPIPKEYQLDINNESVKNTFVFTEKDLPWLQIQIESEVRPFQRKYAEQTHAQQE